MTLVADDVSNPFFGYVLVFGQADLACGSSTHVSKGEIGQYLWDDQSTTAVDISTERARRDGGALGID